MSATVATPPRQDEDLVGALYPGIMDALLPFAHKLEVQIPAPL